MVREFKIVPEQVLNELMRQATIERYFILRTKIYGIAYWGLQQILPYGTIISCMETQYDIRSEQ